MKYKILIPQKGYDYLIEHSCEIATTHGNNLKAILQDVPTMLLCLKVNMSNAILTPHYAAFTEQALNRMAVEAATNIVKVSTVKHVENQVNVPS